MLLSRIAYQSTLATISQIYCRLLEWFLVHILWLRLLLTTLKDNCRSHLLYTCVKLIHSAIDNCYNGCFFHVVLTYAWFGCVWQILHITLAIDFASVMLKIVFGIYCSLPRQLFRAYATDWRKRKDGISEPLVHVGCCETTVNLRRLATITYYYI